ncbi:GAF and ANTAR domain-containing protein [Nocardioides insulae]|uniref:GAF and ANTAR domain-containing protein n=1 Tax=Nocardioides insulae TaxID=394734 RepID=UPI000407BE6F|nr:GAF and ANTAR domain-containing protein [Nocardioides insulae]
MSSDLNAEEFARLAAELHAAPSVTETAEQVVGYAREQLDADHAGITLIQRGGRLKTVAPTSDVVVKVDELQYELKEGSCVDSAWEGETLRAPRLATDPRWPKWGPRAAALGVASVLAISLPDVGGRRVGALNLFWEQSREFSEDEVAFAHVFGRHAAVALATTLQETNLRIALDTRKRIGQAQGILMERFGLDADQSFQVLRRYSQDHNRKLREVAEDLVLTRRLPSQSPPA